MTKRLVDIDDAKLAAVQTELGISPTPLVFDRADGPYLTDVDGNRLIDYYLGMGPMILGHRPDAVVEAVRAQMERGILFGGQSEVEFEAAELDPGNYPEAGGN